MIHRTRHLSAGAVVLVFLLIASSPVSAMEASIGLGAGFGPDYEGSDDYNALPAWQGAVRWDSGQNVQLFGPILKANLLPTQHWELGPMLQYIPERDNVDNNAVDKLKTVDDSLMMGIYGVWKPNHFHVRLHGVQDVSDGNDGFLLQAGVGYTIPWSETFRLIFDFYSTYADDDYMEAYFSIDRKDADRSGLDRFDADEGFKDVGINLTAVCRPYDHWSFTTIGGYTLLVGDAEDSPVVDDEGSQHQFRGFFLVNFHF
jgi:outer membrane protein